MINPRFIVSGQKKRIVRMWKIYRKKENGNIFKQYYLKGLIVVIVVAVLLIAGAIQAATKKAATSLYMRYKKDIINEEDVPALESAIGKYLGMDPKDEVCKN